jgi:hypothetical protein
MGAEDLLELPPKGHAHHSPEDHADDSDPFESG